MADNDGMTDEEFAQMQAALAAEQARRAAAKAEDDAARLAPLLAITSMPGFGEIKTALAALPAELIADDLIGPSIKAVRVGMEGLFHHAPPPTVE